MNKYLVSILGCLVAGFVGLQIYNLFPEQANPHLEEFNRMMSEADIVTFVIMLFITGFVAPAIEEILFRDLLWKVADWLFKNSTAVIISTALIFAAVHGSVAHMFGVLPVAIFLGWLRHKYNSIWLCILGHSFMNTASLVLERI